MKSRFVLVAAVLILLTAYPVVAAAAGGAELYKSKCAMCHGADGSGQTPTGKSMKLRDLRSDEVQKQTDVELTKIISGGKGKMPPFGQKLSNADVGALIVHIRTLKAK
jgi:cytochrome c551